MASSNDSRIVLTPPPLDADNDKPPSYYHMDGEAFILTMKTAFTTTACPS